MVPRLSQTSGKHWFWALVGLALLPALGMRTAPDAARGFGPQLALFVDPDSNAVRDELRLRAQGNFADADAMHALAEASQADWLLGGGNVAGLVGRHLAQIDAQQALPVFVAYNVPGRDCAG